MHFRIDVPEGARREILEELVFEALEEARLERESTESENVRVQLVKYNNVQLEELLADHDADDETALPDSYNQTEITLLLRDPSWAYAFWNLRFDLRSWLRKTTQESLFLRVIDHFGPAGAGDAFTIPLSPEDSSWYINLPRQGTTYSVELGMTFGSREVRLALSNTIDVPAPGLDELPRKDPAVRQVLEASGLPSLYTSLAHRPDEALARLEADLR